MGYELNLSSVKLGDTRKGIWKGLRSEYGTSYSAMNERPKEAEDNDGLLRTLNGQHGVYLVVGSQKRFILDLLREKIQGRAHGVNETRRFFAQRFGDIPFDKLSIGAEDLLAFLKHHNLDLDEEGLGELMKMLEANQHGKVPLLDFLEATDPVNFPKEPPLEPFLSREAWVQWGAIKYGYAKGARR